MNTDHRTTSRMINIRDYLCTEISDDTDVDISTSMRYTPNVDLSTLKREEHIYE